MEELSAQIAVIGGGAIGLATAYRLAALGRDVLVVEPEPEGQGTWYGNAGTIADYAVLPVATPDLFRDLPSLLFGRDSPLSIRLAHLPAIAPWLARFAWQALPGNYRRNAAALSVLLAESTSAWRELVAEIGAQDLLRQNGCLYLYDSGAALERAKAAIAFRRLHGVAQEVLTADEIEAMEPGLPRFEGGGVFFSEALSLTDPGIMMTRIREAARKAGARFVSARAEGLERRDGAVQISAPPNSVKAQRVVIAAGAWSKPLAAQAGDHVPLDTERGYQIEYDMETPPVTRPVSPASLGFYLSPMAGRLRVVGTVELGGLSAPPDPARPALLERGARTLLPDLGKPDRTWMGFRPSVPDSVPVIRPSRGGDDIVLAFGHGHLGLTLAPVTARLVGAMLTGNT